jgi:DNA polymerase IIIc chi subunit
VSISPPLLPRYHLGYTDAVVVRLELHPLSGFKRAGELAQLVLSLYRQGRAVVVWVADDGRRKMLDDYLWTFHRLAFVPHAIWDQSVQEVREPVVLVGQPCNPIDAAVLVVGDEPPPSEWAAGFEEVHDMIPPGEPGDQRRQQWREMGFDV